MKELQEDIMSVRKSKLDNEFVLTQENINALLKLDAELVSVQRKARDEMRARLAELRERLNHNDAFLTDYEIEADITPYLEYPESAEYTMADVFIDLLEGNGSILNFRERVLNDDDELSRFSSTEEAHFIFGSRWTALKDHKFSHGMYELFDYVRFLSFADLLRIKKFWIDVKVEYQREHLLDT
jgi:hypothetical protein